MIALKDLQSTVKGILAAPPVSAAIVNVAVIEDGGKITREQEAALENGDAIIVGAPLGGVTTSQAAGKAIVDVTFPVIIQQNPKTSQKNIYGMIAAVTSLLLSYKDATKPLDTFKLSDKAFIIDDSEAGLWAYTIFFTKQCVI